VRELEDSVQGDFTATAWRLWLQNLDARINDIEARLGILPLTGACKNMAARHVEVHLGVWIGANIANKSQRCGASNSATDACLALLLHSGAACYHEGQLAISSSVLRSCIMLHDDQAQFMQIWKKKLLLEWRCPPAGLEALRQRRRELIARAEIVALHAVRRGWH
jgi:hypothetical protein